jgi:hypothetical protein
MRHPFNIKAGSAIDATTAELQMVTDISELGAMCFCGGCFAKKNKAHVNTNW